MKHNKPDWKDAPKEATHLLTTGNCWEYNHDLVGTYEFAYRNDRGDYQPVDKSHGDFYMDNTAWVVVESRPPTGEDLHELKDVFMVYEEFNYEEDYKHEGVFIVTTTGSFTIIRDQEGEEFCLTTKEIVSIEDHKSDTDKVKEQMLKDWKCQNLDVSHDTYSSTAQLGTVFDLFIVQGYKKD